MTTINAIWTAYDGAKGNWTGCDWHACFGMLGLDLKGLSSGQARLASARWEEIARGRTAAYDPTCAEEAAMVGAAQHLGLTAAAAYPGGGWDLSLQVCGRSARRLCARTLAAEWRYGAEWLQQVESDAAWAEREAGRAVAAAERGDWVQAHRLASRADSISSQYGGRHRWRPLEKLIEEGAA